MTTLLFAACGGGSSSDVISKAAANGSPAHRKTANAPATLPAQVGGLWTVSTAWPFLPIHAALTPDGRVLTYGGNGGNQGGHLQYDIWDPRIPDMTEGHMTLPNGTMVDTFCSAGLLMPQSGNLLTASGDMNGRPLGVGDRNRDLLAFNAQDASLRRLDRGLNNQRWYGTMTMLPSGEVMMQGGICWAGNGAVCGGAVVPTAPEVYRQGQGWVPLLGARDDNLFGNTESRWWYPRSWVAPDGRVFGITAGTHMYFIDPRGRGSLVGAGTLQGRHFGATQSAVMYQPGKVLITGGGGVDSNGREPNGSPYATVLDVTGGSVVVRPTQNMSQGRQWHNSTVLPDGQVLVTGGSTRNNTLEGLTTHAEIWNPQTGAWTKGNSAQTPRLYHSVALLLPDGRVLTGGGGAPGPGPYISAEVYSPPYLFTASGGLAKRPEITSSPGQLGWGSQPFSVDVGADLRIARVTLVGAGAVTHSFDMGQRFVELTFSQNGNRLSVQGPRNANEVPPGMYMLFVLDTNGVPSEARMIRVLDGATQASPDQEAEPDLVHNGSFESPATEMALAPGEWTIGHWPGWQSTAATGLEVWRNHGGYSAASGEHWIELDAYGNSPDTVYQDITTRAGQRYRLSYRFSARPGTQAATNRFEVWWNGTRVGTHAPEGQQLTQTQWMDAEVWVTGTGRDRLRFVDTGTDDGLGALVDDVRLIAARNQLVNGHFESNGVAQGDYALGPIAGWFSPTGLIETWKQHRGYQAAEGSSWVELDVHAGTRDSIAQVVATAPGQSYRLSLSFAARADQPTASTDTSQFEVYWNGQLLASMDPRSSTNERLEWQHRSWIVTGTGRDTVMLREAGADDGLGAMIDNVTLVAVDAPTFNGSAENNRVPLGEWSLEMLKGWTNAAGKVEVWRQHMSQAPAAEGDSLIELDSLAGAKDRLSQWAFTEAGQTYELSLRYRARPGVSADSNAFNVVWNGSVLAKLQPDGLAAGGGAWQTVTYRVLATGFDRIGLDEVGADDSFGALIDGVQLRLVSR